MMKRYGFVLLLCLVALSVNAENWMSRLPDKTFVSTLSIPGAHDAATGSGWDSASMLLGDRYARTQELSIGHLWKIGVRAFDLRPCSHEDHLNINHGIVATVLHFDQVLCQLRDSLVANPSEFVIIHLLHADDGDKVKDIYEQQLLEVLKRSDIRPYLASFKSYLRVSDLRGKILILSRDKYAASPIGGFFQNWTGSADWSRQTQGSIVGANSATGTLYMQDYAETWAEGALQTKIDAINRMLDFSTTHRTLVPTHVVWVFNFASAFSKRVSLLGYDISLSDGYRDNATHTHAAILDYLATHTPGPTGVVLMDYAGIDETQGYATRGNELVRTLIEHNFRYIQENTDALTPLRPQESSPEIYSLSGVRISKPRPGIVNIIRKADGSVTKQLR